ncbi:MAG: hypothetical protein J0H69_08685 [Burkholderiales bacterium]|nr:hypothetical protein [Burkholderiales bacterium]
MSTIPRHRLLLYGLVVAAGLVVWWQVRSPRVPTSPASAPATRSPTLGVPMTAPVVAGARPLLTPAERDPFAAAAPPAVAVPAAPVVVPAPAPVVVAVPSPNLVFQGQVTAPDGQRLVFASLNEVTLQLKEGQALPNGYVVKAISADAVELSHPPTNTSARLELPAAPSYEVR